MGFYFPDGGPHCQLGAPFDIVGLGWVFFPGRQAPLPIRCPNITLIPYKATYSHFDPPFLSLPSYHHFALFRAKFFFFFFFYYHFTKKRWQMWSKEGNYRHLNSHIFCCCFSCSCCCCCIVLVYVVEPAAGGGCGDAGDRSDGDGG